MRRVVLGAASILLAGCAPPPSDGGLWSHQGLEQELVLSRISDQQRIATAHAFELQLADEALSAHQARLETAIQTCSAQQPFDTPDLDSVRIRAAEDSARQLRVAQQALAET